MMGSTVEDELAARMMNAVMETSRFKPRIRFIRAWGLSASTLPWPSRDRRFVRIGVWADGNHRWNGVVKKDADNFACDGVKSGLYRQISVLYGSSDCKF
jgi:hypothetical protein